MFAAQFSSLPAAADQNKYRVAYISLVAEMKELNLPNLKLSPLRPSGATETTHLGCAHFINLPANVSKKIVQVQVVDRLRGMS